MKDWAKREVELACKMERCNKSKDAWDYGCACYKSALKAYKSLCDDGHSGMSWAFTKNILIRLMNSQPLTPITGDYDEWNEWRDGHYQNKRMPSLFKDIDADGNIIYSDVDRGYCIDEFTGCTFTSKILTDILNEKYPITMPYMPVINKYALHMCDFATDGSPGEYDTRGILYLITPDGERVEINKYYKEVDGEMVEIEEGEFLLRLEEYRMEISKVEDEELLLRISEFKKSFDEKKE